eukprot:NODE_90_length_21577_cov_0.697691.p8 type:complete len:359 gc:universal NODE_90_length_21577_cov_0.697691:3696-4772(+)
MDKDLLLRISKIKAIQILLMLIISLSIVPFDRSKDGLLVWDAIHFKNILMHGYEFEHALAFMPGLPILVFAIHSFFWYFPIILVGIIIVNICHVLAAYVLQKLAEKLGINGNVWILYLFTPQVYILSTLYSEFPFSLVTFLGIYAIHSGKLLTSILYFTLASAFRSNGIINLGFIIWYFLSRILKKSVTISDLLYFSIGSILIPMPFIAFQYYAALMYCPGRPWCENLFSYGYIQNHYWQSGLFMYFTKNNIPMFLIVAPILFVILWILPYFARLHYRAWNLAMLFCNPLTPHVVLLLFLLIYGTFAMHVNTLLRLLTSIPSFYFILNSAISNYRVKLLYSLYFGLTMVTNAAFLPPA